MLIFGTSVIFCLLIQKAFPSSLIRDTRILPLTIGKDKIHIPANFIRFSHQNFNEETAYVDLYLSCPSFKNCSKKNFLLINENTIDADRIFLKISENTMSYDMSERVEPVYQNLLEKSVPLNSYGPAIHYFKKDSNHTNEILFTAERPEKPIYAVLCTAKVNCIQPVENSCQKDIYIGKSLSLLYRFPIKLLSEWEN